MATAPQGIMALPQGPAPQAPQMSLPESYEAVRGGLQDASPQAAQMVDQAMAEILPQLDQLSDEELEMMLEVVQFLMEDETEYPQRLQMIVEQGIAEADDFPPQYDEEFLGAVAAALAEALRIRRASAGAEQPPMQMARGGIAEAAKMVASKGRMGDTMLAHITKDEARLLKSRGGSGTINPKTGLPEFFLKKLFKGVTNAVKSVFSSPVGKIVGTVGLTMLLGPGALGIPGLGLSAGAAGALAGGASALLGGGNLKDALRSAAGMYFGAPGGAISQFVGGAGITNAAMNAAASAGLAGAGAGLLTGQRPSDAIRTGLSLAMASGLTSAMTPTVPTAEGGLSASQIGGNVKTAASDLWDKAGDFWNKNISPSGIEAAAKAAGQPAPGLLAKYGPLTAVGLAGIGALGGYKPPQVTAPGLVPRETGIDLYNKNPSQYSILDMDRIKQAGTMGTWNPTPTNVSGVRVPTDYPTIPTYQVPTGGIGAVGMAIPQPYNTPNMYTNLGFGQQPPQGIATLAKGGYPRKTGQIDGPGTETSDSIPAMLSDGEFVMTAKAVRGLGGGSRRQGAKKMYALMHKLERNA